MLIPFNQKHCEGHDICMPDSTLNVEDPEVKQGTLFPLSQIPGRGEREIAAGVPPKTLNPAWRHWLWIFSSGKWPLRMEPLPNREDPGKSAWT